MSNEIRVADVDQVKELFTMLKDKVNSLKIIEKITIKPFAECTWSDITKITNAYYNGGVTLEEIQETWKVGDTKSVNIEQLAPVNESYKMYDNYVAQSIPFVIAGIGYHDLATPINNKTKALLTLHTVNTLDSAPYNGTVVYASVMAQNDYPAKVWSNCERREWLRGAFYNALSSDVKGLVKEITHSVREGNSSNKNIYNDVTDTVFLPTVAEMGLSESVSGLELYPTWDSRLKNRGSTGTLWEYYLSDGNLNYGAYTKSYFNSIRTDKILGERDSFYGMQAISIAIAPMFCI